jgi:death on curing protein
MVEKELTIQHIEYLHTVIENHYQFKYYERGVRDNGLLQLIAERPYIKLYGYEPFPDIYFKCASLIEGIAKGHPFINGNKRTALLAASIFMKNNDYDIVLPLQSVKYSVIIANDNENKIGVDRIARWIRLLSSTNKTDYYIKQDMYLIEPAKMIANLYDSGRTNLADSMLSDWFAYDTYPEYRRDKDKTIHFLFKIAKEEYVLKRP